MLEPKMFPIPSWLENQTNELKSVLDLRLDRVKDWDKHGWAKGEDVFHDYHYSRFVEINESAVDVRNQYSGSFYGDYIRGSKLQQMDVEMIVKGKIAALIDKNIDSVLEENGYPKHTTLIHRNTVIYAPNSGMNWHTNSDAPGVRLYLTYNDKDSFFDYKQNGKFVKMTESKGWHIKLFDVLPEKPYLWHTIKANGTRYSIGYKLT
jgi:hypothetical protein